MAAGVTTAALGRIAPTSVTPQGRRGRCRSRWDCPRPGVAGAVDGPPLHNKLAAAVAVDLARVGVPAVHLTPLHCHGRDDRSRSLALGGGGPLLDQAIGIARMDSRIAIAMEEDQRGPATEPGLSRRTASLHRLQGRGQVLRAARGQAGMHADGRIEVGYVAPMMAAMAPPADRPAT